METRARRGEHGGRYRVVDAHDSHVTVRTSVDGIIETVSPEVTELLGWRPDDWVGRKPFEFVHPDDLMVAQQAHTDVNRGRTVQLVMRMRRRDGEHRWIEAVITPMVDSAGMVVARLGRLVGAHAEQRVHEAVELQMALEHRLAATLDTMFDPHSYLRPVRDGDGEVVDVEFEQVNDALCRYIRCRRSEIEGHLASEVLPSHRERGIVARVREVLETGTPFVAEGLRSYNDLLGEHRLYDITLIPVDGVVSMWHRDVTDRYHQFDVEARMQSMEALQSERERVARDLHDGAIQKVFASSMQLAALAARVPEPHRQQLEQLIDLQDAIIRDLRTTVYQLGTTGRSTTPPDRSVHDTVVEATRALGFDPQVTVDPDVSVVSDTTLGHLLLVLRELLSNVARHARAHRVEVDVYLVGSDVVLGVWDDGVGLPALPVSGNGLTNMRRRAQLLGGGFEVRSGQGDGTEVIWRVPARAG